MQTSKPPTSGASLLGCAARFNLPTRRVQLPARVAVVGCRLGGKGAGKTRSHPALREWQAALGHQGKKAKAFTKCKHVERAAFNLYSAPMQVFVYLATQHNESSNLPSPLSAEFVSGLLLLLTVEFAQRSSREQPRSGRPVA